MNDSNTKDAIINRKPNGFPNSFFIFSPIAATFTDRWVNKAKILYWMDYGRGFFYALTALLVGLGLRFDNSNLVLITVYCAVFFIGVQTAFFNPAVTALVPQIVDKDE